MTTFGVVDHFDVMKVIGTCILVGWVDLSKSPLTLEQLEEALSHRVIVAVNTVTHSAAQMVTPQNDLPNRFNLKFFGKSLGLRGTLYKASGLRIRSLQIWGDSHKSSGLLL